MSKKDPKRLYATNWNPATWVSEKPNEFETYATLDDLRKGAGKSRVRAGLTITCPHCNTRVPHGYDCEACFEVLPCLPEGGTHNT